MNGFVVTYILVSLATIQAAPMQLNTTGDIDCSKYDTGIQMFPNKTDCSKYYQCVNRKKVEMDCPFGQQFNPSLRICDDPKYAGCKVNSTTTSISSTLSPTANSTGFTIIGVKPYNISGPKNYSDPVYSTVREPHTRIEQRNNTEIRPETPAVSIIANSSGGSQYNISASNTSTSNSTAKGVEISTKPVVPAETVKNVTTNNTSTINGLELGKVVIGPTVTIRNNSLKTSTEATLVTVTNVEDVDKEGTESSTTETSEDDENEDDKGNPIK